MLPQEDDLGNSIEGISIYGPVAVVEKRNQSSPDPILVAGDSWLPDMTFDVNKWLNSQTCEDLRTQHGPLLFSGFGSWTQQLEQQCKQRPDCGSCPYKPVPRLQQGKQMVLSVVTGAGLTNQMSELVSGLFLAHYYGLAYLPAPVRTRLDYQHSYEQTAGTVMEFSKLFDIHYLSEAAAHLNLTIDQVRETRHVSQDSSSPIHLYIIRFWLDMRLSGFSSIYLCIRCQSYDVWDFPSVPSGVKPEGSWFDQLNAFVRGTIRQAEMKGHAGVTLSQVWCWGEAYPQREVLNYWWSSLVPIPLVRINVIT